MKKNNNKIEIDINDKYFKEDYNPTRNEPAIINLRTKDDNVSINDLADAIVACKINREKYKRLEISFSVIKSEDAFNMYFFRMYNYLTKEEIVSYLATTITL